MQEKFEILYQRRIEKIKEDETLTSEKKEFDIRYCLIVFIYVEVLIMVKF